MKFKERGSHREINKRDIQKESSLDRGIIAREIQADKIRSLAKRRTVSELLL